MAPEIFVDTSGFYALLVKEDAAHEEAADYLRNAAGNSRFLTTDYSCGGDRADFMSAGLTSRKCHAADVRHRRQSPGAGWRQ